MNTDKIYQQAKDKNVANVIAYADTTNGYICYDEDLDNPVSAEVLEDMFKKGLVIIDEDGAYQVPLSLVPSTAITAYAAVTYLIATTVDVTTTLSLVTLYSEEYTAG